MGRHAGPSLRSVLPGRGVSTASAGGLVALSAVLVGGLTVLGVTLMGVPLPPRPLAVATTPTPTPTPTADVVAPVATPAGAVLARVLGPGAPPGWTPAGPVQWSGGTPFDAACGRPSPDAALSGTRVFDLGRSQVVLTVSAYGAGAGAVVARDWAARLSVCSSLPVSVQPAPATGADAFVVTLKAGTGRSGAAALVWRHGDVLAVVETAAPDPHGLPSLAASVDPVLTAALAGVCANPASTVADAARSPWASGDAFTGLASPIAVTTAPSPTPPAPPGVTPVPASWTPSPLPSVSLPVRPVDPVWPTALPAPVVSPPAPTPLAPAPLASAVPSRLDDPVGPGCGWAFTGQVPPAYDAAAEAALAQTRVTQAQQDLVAQQQAWQVAVVEYWQAVAAYEQQAQAYTAYAGAVRQVAAAWDLISAQRQAYADAVAAYDAAVAAREQFLLDQSAAQTAYDQAVSDCASPPPPGPGPTDASSATPTPTTCPPPVPAILGQTPPAVPTAPTPPPVPGPSG